jgi:formylmethanofuran dehydrogenase subunit E
MQNRWLKHRETKKMTMKAMRSVQIELASYMGSSCLFALILFSLTSGISATHADPVDERYDLLEKMHGHTCAGSLMGARLAIAAREAMGVDRKITATYFDLSCPVDGIQIFAGTTLGNKALTVEDRDEHRLVLIEKESGKKVETKLTSKAQEMGKSYRALSKKLRSLPGDSAQRNEVEGEIEAVFEWFKTAPEKKVVSVTIQ